MDAQRIACAFAGDDVVELVRYETGLCHWVYRCETASGRVFVLRVARAENRDHIVGGIANSRLIAERGIPVARVLGVVAAKHFGVLERTTLRLGVHYVVYGRAGHARRGHQPRRV